MLAEDDLTKLMELWKDAMASEKALDGPFHGHKETMRNRLPDRSIYRRNNHYPEDNYLYSKSRPVVDETKKRRPTRPLIAIGMDRRINVPTEALALYRKKHQPGISVSTVIIPDRKVTEGILIKGTTIAWAKIAETLKGNWTRAFSIPADKWEEIIAGAYERAGYDQVILTPRSGDFGRDVIAVKYGIGCIKIIGSVKAYAPGHLVKHDDVRALLGVLGGERDASKGIITTTSDFAPRIATDPFIKPYLPTRLELMNGERLQMWLASLLETSGHRT